MNEELRNDYKKILREIQKYLKWKEEPEEIYNAIHFSIMEFEAEHFWYEETKEVECQPMPNLKQVAIK